MLHFIGMHLFCLGELICQQSDENFFEQGHSSLYTLSSDNEPINNQDINGQTIQLTDSLDSCIIHKLIIIYNLYNHKLF